MTERLDRAIAEFKKVLADERGKRGRDMVRKKPQGLLLDALDAGAKTTGHDDWALARDRERQDRRRGRQPIPVQTTEPIGCCPFCGTTEFGSLGWPPQVWACGQHVGPDGYREFVKPIPREEWLKGVVGCSGIFSGKAP